MRAVCVAVMLGSACGRVEFERTASPNADGNNDSDACPRGFGPWGDVTRISATNAATGYDEWEPALHRDGLLLVFQSNRPEGSGLYATQRASLSAPFGPARELTELYNAGVQDGGVSPMWSADGTRLFYVRYQPIGSGPAVAPYLGGDAFGTWMAVDLPYPHAQWDMSDDELELFYTNEEGDGGGDLEHGTRGLATEAWAFDNALAPLDVPGMIQGWPSFDDARQDLYYETEASIMVARRTSGVWSAGVALDLGENVGDPEISSDGRTLVFDSTRPGGAGSHDLYYATRDCR